MAINFSDTLASIHADLNQRTAIFSVILGALFLCWAVWLIWAPMSITKQAHGFIEINQPALTLVAPTAGRIEFVGVRVHNQCIINGVNQWGQTPLIFLLSISKAINTYLYATQKHRPRPNLRLVDKQPKPA